MQAKWPASLSELLPPGIEQSAAAVQVGTQVDRVAPAGLAQMYFELWSAAAQSLVDLHPCHSHVPAVQAKWLSSLSGLPGLAQPAAAVQVGMHVETGAPAGFTQLTLVVLNAVVHSAVDAQPRHSHLPAVQA